MTDSLASLCYLLVALLLGLGIGGTIWLVSEAVKAVKLLKDATRSLAEAPNTLTTGMQALVAEIQTAHETLGVVTEQVTKLWVRTSERVKDPRPWHAKDAVNGMGQDEAEEREYEQDWRNG